VAVQEEVEMTLLALGYTPTEISNALNAIASLPILAKTQDIEAWIKGFVNPRIGG